MGYWPDPSTVVITDVIGPGPNSKHTRHSFYPDAEYHYYEIERIYVASDRFTKTTRIHADPSHGTNTV